MLPHNDVIAHVELNENALEYFLQAKYGSSYIEPNFNEWVQILISYGNPLEAYAIQGTITFYHLPSKLIIETTDTECARVEDILGIYTDTKTLSCTQSLTLVA